MFFSIKESYASRMAKRKKEKEQQSQMEEDMKVAYEAEKKRKEEEEAAKFKVRCVQGALCRVCSGICGHPALWHIVFTRLFCVCALLSRSASPLSLCFFPLLSVQPVAEVASAAPIRKRKRAFGL